MRHLTLPFLAAIIAGICLALLVRALYTGADSIVVIALIGLLYFAWRCVIDARTVWPEFLKELQDRRAARAKLPADDTR